MTGSVSPLYEPAMLLGRAGVVPGYDMTTEAALTKLSCLLASPDLSTEDVVQQMSSNLCGELTEHAQMIFQHPVNQLPSRQTGLSRLNYAIAEGDVHQLREVIKSAPRWLLNEGDYTGNTPLVSPFLLIYRSRLTEIIASRSHEAQHRDLKDAPLARCLCTPAK